MTSIALYDKSSVYLTKTFDEVAKNGTEVVKYLDMSDGATVTHAYKKGVIEPFKEIVQRMVKRNNVPHNSGEGFTLNTTEKITEVRELNKQPISINTIVEEWFYKGKPTTIFTRGLKSQKDNHQLSWVKSEFISVPSYGKYISMSKDGERIHFKWDV